MLAGEFGAAARLTPKALRLYAELGLLVPVASDPVTGYRYYAPHQLPRARMIARLRRLGLPLARITYLVDLPPDMRAVELRGWIAGQRDLLAERVALVEAIERGPDSAALVGAVQVRDVAATKLLCRAATISTALLADFVAASQRDIRAHLRSSGRSDDGGMRVQFQDLVTYDSEGTVEVAIPYEGSVEPSGNLHIRLAPAHRAAVLPTPPGYEDYPEILHVYDAIEEWSLTRAAIAGHPYELHPGETARFDVAYPIREV
jgi:DNA-binding transcriptional MerR regulator